jgi:ABC-type antimicrobial peptide transport system permease subunit
MMILLETFFLILSGCPIGIALALVTIGITQKTGIDLTQYVDVYSNFGYSHIIYPNLTLSQLETVLILVIFAAFISALFPARRALKLNPAESLKK